MEQVISNSFKDIYDQTESLRGKRLVGVIVGSIVVFLIIGILLGNFMDSRLKDNETTDSTKPTPRLTSAPATLEGTISYVGPDYLPEYEINYTLTDSDGNDIALLRSSDEKLEIVQGLFVKVTGKKSKTPDGKYDILQVSEIVINNGSN